MNLCRIYKTDSEQFHTVRPGAGAKLSKSPAGDNTFRSSAAIHVLMKFPTAIFRELLSDFNY